MAKVHKNEVITYLPKGSNVITNKNVEAMERMNRSRPFIPDTGGRGSVTVQPADNRDILRAIERQTDRMERMERKVELNISEFERMLQMGEKGSGAQTAFYYRISQI
ncbi:hypothetical protein [Thiohalophilus sp.]|uniref:hypothetical protein n=1 Tax=Thiohalophilus sp. TaxID=3028392 RepID=UPI002ACD9647|nr:hypothetical protein [Thiohalophilus sp.]MDZ7802355.1 hypothetical protein [Thiohalophilus sp.]